MGFFEGGRRFFGGRHPPGRTQIAEEMRSGAVRRPVKDRFKLLKYAGHGRIFSPDDGILYVCRGEAAMYDGKGGPAQCAERSETGAYPQIRRMRNCGQDFSPGREILSMRAFALQENPTRYNGK